MHELTNEEKKVLELVSRKGSLTTQRISRELSREGADEQPDRAKRQAAIEQQVAGLVDAELLSPAKPGRAARPGDRVALTPAGWRAEPLLISFLNMRKAMGIVGIALPFVLALGNLLLGDVLNLFTEHHGLQGSISAYYYTGMGDVFVGAIFAIALILFSYRGNGRGEYISTKIAGIAAVLVALFPTAPQQADAAQLAIGAWHLRFAGTLFLALAYISLFSFTRPDPVKDPAVYGKSQGKGRRNAVYVVCGLGLLASIVLVPVLRAVLGDAFDEFRLLFVLETTALFFFGMSWVTKSGWIISSIGYFQD